MKATDREREGREAQVRLGLAATGREPQEIDETLAQEITRGKDFVQIKNGPFDVDLVFAPDGIESYEDAKSRIDTSSGFPVANIRDIIESKRAAGRPRDAIELPQLQDFRRTYEEKN